MKQIAPNAITSASKASTKGLMMGGICVYKANAKIANKIRMSIVKCQPHWAGPVGLKKGVKRHMVMYRP